MLRQFSVKFLLGFALTFPFLSLAIIGYLLFKDWQKDIKLISQELREETTEMLEENIDLYVALPPLVNKSNATAITLGEFDFLRSGEFSQSDLSRLTQLLSDSLQESKEIHGIYLGTTQEKFMGLEWKDRQKGILEIVINQQTEGKFDIDEHKKSEIEFRIIDNNSLVKKPFEPTQKPWYAKHCNPTRTQIYLDDVTGESAVTAIYPFCDTESNVIAVLASDFLACEVNNFLKALKTKKINRNGEIFIVNAFGELVAGSSERTCQDRIQITSDSKKAKNKLNRIIQNLDKNDRQEIANNQRKNMTLDEEQYSIVVDSIAEDVNWLTIIAIPQQTIIDRANENHSSRLWLYLLALLLTIGVTLLALRWIILQNFLTAANRFVPLKFLKLLEKEFTTVERGDQVEKIMTIMFADIRNFTTLSEKLNDPQLIFSFVNNYLDKVVPIIHKHNGIIANYMGDGIMAVFFDRHSTVQAINAAIQMQKEIEKSNHENSLLKNIVPSEMLALLEEVKQIKIGIGLHTGKLMLGAIGSDNSLQTTVIADAVNLASRIEGLTKQYGVDILISEQAYSNLELDPSSTGSYLLRFLQETEVKGKKEKVRVYAVDINDFENEKLGQH